MYACLFAQKENFPFFTFVYVFYTYKAFSTLRFRKKSSKNNLKVYILVDKRKRLD